MKGGLEVGQASAFDNRCVAVKECSYEHLPLCIQSRIFDAFYCAYIKGDAAKEPITTGDSIPAIIAKAAEKTGRPRADFEVEQISRERHEKLKQFLF